MLLAIAHQHAIKEPPQSATFVGRATLLGPGEDQEVFGQLFQDRLGAKQDIIARAADPDGPQFYKITPAAWYYYGAPAGAQRQTFTYFPAAAG